MEGIVEAPEELPEPEGGVNQESAPEQQRPEKLLQVRRYNVAGQITRYPYIVEDLERALDTGSSPLADLPEVTEKYLPEIAEIQKTVRMFGEDLGVDVEPRMRSIDYVHVHPREHGDELRRRQDGDMAAITMSTGHQVIIEERTPAQTLSSVSHEGIHGIAYTCCDPMVTFDQSGRYEVDLTAGSNRSGYGNSLTREFQGMTEVLTELASQELMRDYWPTQPQLSKLPVEDTIVTYEGFVVMLDRIIAQADKPVTTYRTLQQGLLTGDMEGLQMLVPIIGGNGLEMLSKVDPMSNRSAMQIATALGYRDELILNRRTRPTDLLRWLPKRTH
jgi:hypothetical protein